MLEADFSTFNIDRVTPGMIRASGAFLEDVSILTISTLNSVAEELCVLSPFILKNGLTTGSHKSPFHRDGTAVDVFLGDVSPSLVLKAALNAGFRGFGFYTNEKDINSYHLDLRPELGFWRKKKFSKTSQWDLFPFLL
ncbi:MAG: hypothetical protein KAS32_14765 [Candidatus Peribacteraceae bacterium]|nr:hypothetical protein [Candidatus Peribacteraceae bacterium]